MNEYTTLQQMQTTIWELYKDVHGMRPRYWTQQEWESREFLQQQYNRLLKIVAAMPQEQDDTWMYAVIY